MVLLSIAGSLWLGSSGLIRLCALSRPDDLGADGGQGVADVIELSFWGEAITGKRRLIRRARPLLDQPSVISTNGCG